MFAKLLKYDLKSTKKPIIVLLFVILGATLLGSINTLLINLLLKSGQLSPFWASMIAETVRSLRTISIIILAFAFFACAILMLGKFYQSTATDEAYLTFTLPAKPYEILLSKYIAEILRCTEIFFASVAGLFVIAVTEVLTVDRIGDTVYEDKPLGSEIWGLIIAAIVLIVFYSLSSMMMYNLAIFTGSVVAKKHKLLAGIGMIYLFHFVTSFAAEIFVVVSVFGSVHLNFGEVIGYVTVSMYVAAGISALLGVLFFFLTERLLRKKLNLA